MAFGDVAGVSFAGGVYHDGCAIVSLDNRLREWELNSAQVVAQVTDPRGAPVQVGHETVNVVLFGQDDEFIYGVGDALPASCDGCCQYLAPDAGEVARKKIARRRAANIARIRAAHS